MKKSWKRPDGILHNLSIEKEMKKTIEIYNALETVYFVAVTKNVLNDLGHIGIVYRYSIENCSQNQE